MSKQTGTSQMLQGLERLSIAPVTFPALRMFARPRAGDNI
jgi:hypothetical protein